LDGGRDVEARSEVSEEHLCRMLGRCADPISEELLGRAPNRAQPSLEHRILCGLSRVARTWRQ
jgi:hypothetical protein